MRRIPVKLRLLLAVILSIALFESGADGFQATTEQVSSPRYQRFVDDLFSQFDKNEDGVIQQAEHEYAYVPLLRLADADSNQSVSREEVIGWLQGNTLGSIQKQMMEQIENDVPNQWQQLAEQGRPELLNSAPVQQPQLVNMTFVLLGLPEDIAKREFVSLKDLARVVTTKKFDKKALANNGITLLELYEFSATDGKECRLGFGYAEQLENRYFYSKPSGGEGGFGTSLNVLPEIVNGELLLNMDFAAILSNKDDLEMRKVGVETSLVFTKDASTKLINLYSEGVHYLLIVTAKIRSSNFGD